METRFPSSGDQKLIQIVDAALADVTREAGNGWSAALDARNAASAYSPSINSMRRACSGDLPNLKAACPERAARVRQRARESVARLSPEFPGDPSAAFWTKEKSAASAFAEFANDEPCPALDPETGNCELYESRPMTCRVFGPPVRSEDGLGVCELCFHGAIRKRDRRTAR